MKSAVKTVPATILFALVTAACLVLAGCSGAASQSAASSSEASSSASSSAASGASSSLAAQAEEGLVFGEKTATALSIVFTNDTGADITGLSALPASGGTAVVLMKETDKLPAGEKMTVYVEPAPDGVFNLSFKAGDTERQLHNVDFARFSDVTIKMEDDVAYITMVLNGSAVGTLREEYDIVHPPAAEEPAAEGESEEEPNVEETYVEEPYVEEYYEEPAAESTNEAPAQSEDGCMTDVVLR